jgi:hypothetical protein
VRMVLSVTTDIRTKTKGDTFIARIEQIFSRSELKEDRGLIIRFVAINMQ